MRDFPLQISQRDQTPANRRLKTATDLNRNLPKAAKRSLIPAFKPEEESAVLESPKEFSEVSDDNLFSESTENFFASVHASQTHSTEKVAISDLTSTLPTSVEEDVVITHLREARVQVMKSKGVGASKKLMLALLNVIIEDFHGGLYEEDEWFDKLLSRQSNMVLLISIMVIFPLLMVLFIMWSSKESFTSLTPT